MPTRPVVCVVPLRSPGDGKSRLSPGLDRGARAELAAAMLSDVIGALRGSTLDRVVVAASDATAAAVAAALDVEVLLDPPGAAGLDAAIAHAATVVSPDSDLVVVQADLPALTPADVDAVVAAAGAVVIAPTGDGGTGALLRRPATCIPTAFGAGSTAAHRDLARAAGFEPVVLELAGFATDVDTWADLETVAAGAGPATLAFLGRLAEAG
jgi:2-phospho-L-lactate/phosphoenolpyruvate guanylyltransferase